MHQEVFVSGKGSSFLDDKMAARLKAVKPEALGISMAFISLPGLTKLEKMVASSKTSDCKIIAGLDNAITHPAALQRILDLGWELRLSKKSSKGIYHPKLLIGGDSFGTKGDMKNPNFLYIGSSNLTMGGLRNNIECGLLATADGIPSSSISTFSELWGLASPATTSAIKNYGALFAERARKRSVPELVDLGINDDLPPTKAIEELLSREKPAAPVLDVDFAIAAWAGLQSFTGEYRLQVEFPKNAGRVISRLIGNQTDGNGKVEVYCIDESATRKMQFKFYEHNGMFRLNIPNNIPNADWVREHRNGVALVERGLPGGAPISIRLLRPGEESNEIVSRSSILGTWGKTSTRTYGWY